MKFKLLNEMFPKSKEVQPKDMEKLLAAKDKALYYFKLHKKYLVKVYELDTLIGDEVACGLYDYDPQPYKYLKELGRK